MQLEYSGWSVKDLISLLEEKCHLKDKLDLEIKAIEIQIEDLALLEGIEDKNNDSDKM